MKDITLIINLPPYLAAWLTATHGSPARFPKKTPLATTLHYLLSRPPKDYQPPLLPQGEGSCRIRLPNNAYKKPEYYHYLSPTAEHRFRSVLLDLFDLHLWASLSPYLLSRQLLAHTLDFCHRYGIPSHHVDTLLRRFRRMRRRYQKQGILIRRPYHPRTPQQP